MSIYYSIPREVKSPVGDPRAATYGKFVSIALYAPYFPLSLISKWKARLAKNEHGTADLVLFVPATSHLATALDFFGGRCKVLLTSLRGFHAEDGWRGLGFIILGQAGWYMAIHRIDSTTTPWSGMSHRSAHGLIIWSAHMVRKALKAWRLWPTFIQCLGCTTSGERSSNCPRTVFAWTKSQRTSAEDWGPFQAVWHLVPQSKFSKRRKWIKKNGLPIYISTVRGAKPGDAQTL